MDLPWIALHVNDERRLSENESTSLVKNINLAKDLGAEYISTNNPDIALGIKHIVHDYNVNLIVVGRTHKSIYILNQFSLFERLAKECHDIDLLVVKEDFTPIPSIFSIFKLSSDKFFLNYFSILCFTALLGLINLYFLPIIGYKIAGLVFLSGILLFSLFYTKGPLLASAIMSAIIWGGLFLTPEELIDLRTPENLAVLILYFLTAFTAGVLGERSAKQKRMLQHHEESTQALYEIVHCILANTSTKDTLNDIEACLEKTLGGKCEIIVKDPTLRPNTLSKLTGDEKEKAAAFWVLENGKEAGLSTSTLPQCQNFYFPVMGYKHPVAVIVYRPPNKDIIHNEKNFLHTVGHHLSLYISHYTAETTSKVA
jgi:two-component system sensor histidine kinase KdpD